MEAFARAEKLLKPDWRLMFTDVYEKMTPNLKIQLKAMEEHLEKYGDHYPLKNYLKQEEKLE